MPRFATTTRAVSPPHPCRFNAHALPRLHAARSCFAFARTCSWVCGCATGVCRVCVFVFTPCRCRLNTIPPACTTLTTCPVGILPVLLVACLAAFLCLPFVADTDVNLLPVSARTYLPATLACCYLPACRLPLPVLVPCGFPPTVARSACLG